VIPVTVYYNLENDDPQWRTWFFGPVRLVRPTAEDEKTEKLLQEKNVKNAAARRAMLRAKSSVLLMRRSTPSQTSRRTPMRVENITPGKVSVTITVKK